MGIGPDAERHKYRQVLEMIGGKNLFFVDDYANLDDATQDIVKLICRKYNLGWVCCLLNDIYFILSHIHHSIKNTHKLLPTLAFL